MIGWVYEAMGIQKAHGDDGDDAQSKENDHLNRADDNTLKFYQLLEDASRELYPGCTEFTKLSFTMHLLNLKVRSGWTNKSFTSLLELLKKAFLRGVNLPKDFGEANKISKDLGFTYETWDVCPNNCMLFRGKDIMLEICGTSRYKECDRKIVVKKMRYFPLKPRLQKLFISSHTSSLMRWHAEGRVDDGTFRHPADSLAWKDFGEKNIDFSIDSRNVRLGLTADGFSPFKLMNVSHNSWPVVLIPYNLPPWICMGKDNFILVVLIYGPKGPTLMWTINDFPGYSMHSGSSHMYSYTYHRQFLSRNHRFRRDTTSFDGTMEWSVAPKRLSGIDVLQQLDSNGVLTEKPFHAFKLRSGRWCLPPGPCNMGLNEKDVFCKVLKSIRAPDGYASNISKCVQIEKRTIWDLKSHDKNVLMQNLLHVVVRKALPKHVVEVLIELSTFFRKLCSKANDSSKDKRPQTGVVHYYGVLTDIIQIHYSSNLKHNLFKCDWISNEKGLKIDQFKFTLVNFNHVMYTGREYSDEPYILSTQVEQVWYVDDPLEADWKIVMKMNRRDNFDVYSWERQTSMHASIELDDRPVFDDGNGLLMARRRKHNGWTMTDVIGEIVGSSSVHDSPSKDRGDRVDCRSRFGLVSNHIPHEASVGIKIIFITIHIFRNIKMGLIYHLAQNTTNTSVCLKKGRGRSKLIARWNSETKLQLEITAKGEVDGPNRVEFQTQLGVMARNSYRFPLIYTSFDQMPQCIIEDLWSEIKARTTLPEEAKSSIIENFVEVDDGVLEIRQNKAERNTKNIAQYKFQHRLGRLPLSELTKQQGTEPSRIDKFCMSRAPNSKPPVNQDTANLITQMRESISCVPEAERTRELEETIWTEFMGTSSHGRVRCEGQGVKPSRYQQTLTLSSYDIMKKKIREEVTQEVKEGISEENEQMRVQREQMRNEILEMREERERMKGLMEQMTKKITQTRAEMTQEVVEDVVSYFGLGSVPVAPFAPSTTPFRPTTTPFRPFDIRQVLDSSSTDRASSTRGAFSTLGVGASTSSNDSARSNRNYQ
ncbi:hypothetical protein BUALT_Bualt09G0055300 [Buddleja alternifolia]|uniref:DUF4216 domain-containing protein n=1 Tax=Buddleja alternifolia TaxID=168488 RepID=A0AAV6X1F3_9LAMI|nr:hypothetical protein BUALT_Bualt09G0055300 [Buddleja alternifolia]